VTYLRCHDDIGWAIDDVDAAAVGVSGFHHRQFLADYYSGRYPSSTARGLVFQYNPVTQDRRISGMAASLSGLDVAVDAQHPAAVHTVVGRLFLAHAVVLGWGGIPVIWMGDEIGLTNDPDWASEPGHESDNRWVHRPRMDWELAARRHDGAAVPGALFGHLRHLVEVRASLPHFHSSIAATIGEIGDPGVLPVVRRHPLGTLLGLYNVTDSWRPYPGHVLAALGLSNGIDRISGGRVRPGGDGNLWLEPYSAMWITSEG